MCLFDVVVALDVKKIEKKCLFLYFFNAKRHLPIFSDIFAIVADKVTFRTLGDIFADTIYVTLL